MRDQATEPRADLHADEAQDVRPVEPTEADEATVDEPFEMDEVAILQRLGMAARPQPALFAAACAERLLPLYRAYAEEHGGDPEALARALDSVWATVLPKYRVNRARLADTVRELYPAVDAGDSGRPDSGHAKPADDLELTAYAQNAAAAVLHALRIAESGGLQDAVWAARQVTEVAEHAAQVQLPDCDPGSPNDKAVLDASPVVREAHTAMAMDLAHALTVARPAEAEMVRALARAGGEELARLAAPTATSADPG